jgi:FMN phosphatase YigB (HAD superfamily)
MGLISNADSRIRLVLQDLEVLQYFDPIVLSEEEGIEKPTREIFARAIARSRSISRPDECVHVGDDLERDYRGALNANMHALLLRRPMSSKPEDLGVAQETVLDSLNGVLKWVI